MRAHVKVSVVACDSVDMCGSCCAGRVVRALFDMRMLFLCHVYQPKSLSCRVSVLLDDALHITASNCLTTFAVR
jgi:hypothetical protein